MVGIFWMISNFYPDAWLQALDSWLFKLNAKHLSNIISLPPPPLSILAPTLTPGWLLVSLSLDHYHCTNEGRKVEQDDELTKFLQSPQLRARWWPGLTGRMQHWSWWSCFSSHFPVQYSAENYQWLQFTETSVGKAHQDFHHFNGQQSIL